MGSRAGVWTRPVLETQDAATDDVRYAAGPGVLWPLDELSARRSHCPRGWPSGSPSRRGEFSRLTVRRSGRAATCSAVPDPRPISDEDAKRVRAALAGVRAAQDELERAVAGALLEGASVRAVSELGLSPNTVQEYGRAHGRPTEENRLRSNESRWDRYGREDDDERSARRSAPSERLQANRWSLTNEGS